MAHSRKQSTEDHDEDHGEHHDEGHGEYQDENHGEYDDEDYGEYLDEDHGEHHGEYTFETSEYTSGASALLRNAIKGPGMKLAEWSAKSGETFGVARARVQEQASKAGASINYGVYSFTHPFDPVRRIAAREAKDQRKELATDRRKAKESKAHGKAASKIAKAREGRIQTLEEGVH